METIEIQVKNLIDKRLISDLLTNYFRAIDDKCFDMAVVEATFANNACIVRPNGSETVGHDNILDVNNKSFARFKVTQHLLTDRIIDINDNAATLRANLTGMHLWADDDNNPSLNGKHFHAGVVLTAKAIKAHDKWRFYELTYRNVLADRRRTCRNGHFLKNLKP